MESRRKRALRSKSKLKKKKIFNAYSIFVEERRKSCKNKNIEEPSITQISIMWDKLTDSERKKYVNKMNIEKSRLIETIKKERRSFSIEIKKNERQSFSAGKSCGNIYWYSKEINEMIVKSCTKPKIKPNLFSRRKSAYIPKTIEKINRENKRRRTIMTKSKNKTRAKSKKKRTQAKSKKSIKKFVFEDVE